METCENCNRTIGNLETPQVIDQHVVCAECYQKLAPQRADYQSPPPMPGPVEIDYESPLPPSAPHPVGGGGVVDRRGRYASQAVAGASCPACGYRGQMKKKAKGSLVVLILLLLLWILPGIIYLFVYNGHKFVCPKCGAKVADA